MRHAQFKNKDYPASPELRKLYQVVADAAAAKHHQVRGIDESGEDYLYPEEYFVSVSCPKSPKSRAARGKRYLPLRSNLLVLVGTDPFAKNAKGMGHLGF